MSSNIHADFVSRFDLPKRTRPGRRKKAKFIAIDFFCGAGGTTRGLINAGGYVAAGIDKVDTCARTYVSNNGNETLDRNYPAFLAMDVFPKTQGYPEGQQTEIFDALDKIIPEARNFSAGVPLLFAICAPCQPFTRISSGMSDARTQKREADKSLLLHACRFVAKYRPEYVLSENVAGIRKQKFGGIWSEFENELEKLGYVTGSKVVCASKFGIGQRRKRSILAAARKDTFADNLPDQLTIPDADPKSGNVSAGEILAGLPSIGHGKMHPSIPNHLTRSLNSLNELRISHAPAGGSNAYLENTPDGDLSLACHRKVNGKFGGRCFGDTYTRMDPTEPSPTITTKCHSFTNGRFGHPDTNQKRCISMREAARLQSFSDEYIFYPKDQLTGVAKQIGNAVPPKLAEFFASHLVAGIHTESPTR